MDRRAYITVAVVFLAVIMAPGLMTIVGAMGLLAAVLRREDAPDGR